MIAIFQDGAHHGRREQDGAFFGLDHGITRWPSRTSLTTSQSLAGDH